MMDDLSGFMLEVAGKRVWIGPGQEGDISTRVRVGDLESEWGMGREWDAGQGLSSDDCAK